MRDGQGAIEPRGGGIGTKLTLAVDGLDPTNTRCDSEVRTPGASAAQPFRQSLVNFITMEEAEACREDISLLQNQLGCL